MQRGLHVRSLVDGARFPILAIFCAVACGGKLRYQTQPGGSDPDGGNPGMSVQVGRGGVGGNAGASGVTGTGSVGAGGDAGTDASTGFGNGGMSGNAGVSGTGSGGVRRDSGSDGSAGADGRPRHAVGTLWNPGFSCQDILLHGGSRGNNGTYWIDPGGSVFEVLCEMTIDGGGWTNLIAAVASALPAGEKRYLYVYNDRWYESPLTVLDWDWTVGGRQLTGTYDYFDGSAVGSFTCSGSTETPLFGVGCSNGAGGTLKCLPYYAADPAGGQCEICQDQPDAFGTGPCAPADSVKVYYR